MTDEKENDSKRGWNDLDLYTEDELIEHLYNRCDCFIFRGQKTDLRTGTKIEVFGNKGKPLDVLLLIRPIMEGYIELLYGEYRTKSTGSLFNLMGMFNFILGLLKEEAKENRKKK